MWNLPFRLNMFVRIYDFSHFDKHNFENMKYRFR